MNTPDFFRRPRLLAAAALLLAAPLLQARVLFVNNTAQPNGDGSSGAPLSSLASAQAAAQPGDVITLAASATPYRGSIVLKEGESLVAAEGATAAPVIISEREAAITMANNTTVTGVEVRDSPGHAIDVSGAENVTISSVKLINDAGRNGVSAATCGGDVRGNSIAYCNAALFVQNAKNVTLTNVVIDGSAQLGIAAENVTGLRMTDVEVRNAGNEGNESGVVLRNPGGDVTLTGCRFHDSAGRELHIENTKSDVHVRIDHCTFTHGEKVLFPALLAGASGSASLTIDVAGSTFSGAASDGIHATAAGNGKLTLNVGTSTFDRDAVGVLAGASSGATLDVSITGTKFLRSSLSAINIASTGGGTVTARVADNDIAGAPAASADCGGCNGMVVMSTMTGHMTVTIDSNTIHHVEGSAVRVVAGDNSDMRAAVTGNTIREPLGAADTAAIHVQAGTLKKDTATVCADVRANVISGTWSPSLPPISIWNRFPGTTVKLPGFAADGKAAPAVAAFIARNNRGVKAEARLTTDPAGNAFAGGERCVKP